jgi:hypothetical protein
MVLPPFWETPMSEHPLNRPRTLDTPAKLRERAVLQIDKRAMRALRDFTVAVTLEGEEVECRAYLREARRHQGVWLVPCDAGLYGFFSMQALPDEVPAETILRVLAAMALGGPTHGVTGAGTIPGRTLH